MKKLFAAIIVICIVLTPLLAVQSVKAENPNNEYISADRIDELTQGLCAILPDRTSFTEANLNAALKIAGLVQNGAETISLSDARDTFNDMEFLSNANLDIQVQKFTQSITVLEKLSYVKKEIDSYNIIAKLKNHDPAKKTVLITTNFANHYSDNAINSGVKVEGALYNAASTALTIELANYLSARDDNMYNYVFAFFSGTDEGNFGSAAFAEKYLGQDIMLAINLERLGCGTTYFYTDEAETEHGKFIKQFSSSYDLKEFPSAGRVLLDMETVEGLPYSHYAMRGDISSFLSAGKSCLELIGGNFKGLSDGEGGKNYVTNTSYDTYENLVANHPDYAQKLSDVASFIIDLTLQKDLENVCLGAATSYKIFTQSWVAYVICLGIIIVLILVMILVLNRLEKKYPIPAQPKIKIAVFGKEYEDFNQNEIIVDIKRNDDSNNGNDINPFDV